MKYIRSRDDNFSSPLVSGNCAMLALGSPEPHKSNLRGQNAALDEKFETMQGAGEYRPEA